MNAEGMESIDAGRGGEHDTGAGEGMKPDSAVVPGGWLSIDSSVVEATPEEEREAAERKKRRDEAETILTSLTGLKTLDDFTREAGSSQGEATASGAADIRRAAKANYDRYLHDKNNAITWLMEKELPPGEMKELADAAFEAAKLLRSADEAEAGTFNQFRSLGSVIFSADTAADARQYREFASVWRDRLGLERETGSNGKRLAIEFERIIKQLSGVHISPRPERSPDDRAGLFTSFVELHEFAATLPSDYDAKAKEKFIWAAETSGQDRNDPEQTRKMLEIFKLTATQEKGKLAVFAENIGAYARNHGLTEDSVHGLVEKLLLSEARRCPSQYLGSVTLRSGD